MTLIETLLVKLGPAVAKSILAIWLKDPNLSPNFTADAAADVLDILKGKTADIIVQRRAARRFVEIGERVAENLQPIIESEGSRIDEASLHAVVLEVVDTLSRSGIDARLLAERDLDPGRLYNYLLSSRPHAMQHFTDDETHLYHRVLSECSQYIIDIASHLPSFTERTLSEILKREGQLLGTANEILATARSIQESSRRANRDHMAEYFESEYRRHIERKLGQIRIFGVEASVASTKYGLSVAYLSLMVNRNSRYGHHSDDEIDLVTVDEALARSRRLLLLGVPGSGKTTLLQWIAVNAATNSFPEQLKAWNGRIPFLIRLREFAKADLPAPHDFIKSFAPVIEGEMPTGWVSNLLRSGRAVVLVDGVDEVPQTSRGKVSE